MRNVPGDEFEAKRTEAFAKYRESKRLILCKPTTAAERMQWLGASIELLKDYLPPRDESDPRVTFDAWGSPDSDAFPSPDDGPIQPAD